MVTRVAAGPQSCVEEMAFVVRDLLEQNSLGVENVAQMPIPTKYPA
jgi:hypothetical protein